MKFLIVDDSRIMRQMIKQSLENSQRENYEVIEADNGIDAFNIIESETIDLLLVDWNMPHLNGLDLVRELRNLKKHKKLPIIMITSEAAKYSVIEAVKAGVNDYIIKPVKDSDLLDKIDRLLDV